MIRSNIPSQMKQLRLFPLFLTLLAGGLALLTGCKTTEANYRQAYQTAVAQRQDATGIDSTIYARIRNSATTSSLAVEGDTLPLRTVYIGFTDGGGMDKATMRKYSVVVGQFKQVFNARQMRERLISSGYGDAFIIHTREPLYYVAIVTSDNPDEILAAWKRVTSDKSIVLRAPLPFVLRPAHLAR